MTAYHVPKGHPATFRRIGHAKHRQTRRTTLSRGASGDVLSLARIFEHFGLTLWLLNFFGSPEDSSFDV
jgi:hypothetical protein